jgi:serine O-acetyltransferase
MFNIISFLRSIKKRDPSANNYLEIILSYPGVHAVFFYKIANILSKCKVPILPRFISYVSYVITGIDIHQDAIIGKNLFIDHGCGIVIGQQTIIGDNVLIYQGVTLGARSVTPVVGRRHPKIGNNVIIGAGAKVLGGVTIGDNARIGSNSLIISDVPANKTIFSPPSHDFE